MFAIPRPSRSTLHCSLAALTTVLLMAWVRPLGVLFLGLFSYWLYWTRCNFRIVPTPELRKKFEFWLQRAESWRLNSPSMFCLASSGCLASLAILGHLISGSTLVLTILLLSALISTKYNFKLLQIEQKDFQWSEKLTYNNLETEVEDEFLPDVNESNLFVLERASDVATISSPIEGDNDDDEDERSDDIPSELLIPDVIPEIDEHSTDEDDELSPLTKHKAKTTATTNSSDKLNNDKATMDFRRGHFKRDSSLSTTSSSSSSEECLSKGLQFPDHTTVDAGGSKLPQLTSVSASTTTSVSSHPNELVAQAQALLPSLVNNLVQWGAATAVANAISSSATSQTSDAQADVVKRRLVTSLDSSDESDFEILETDDFK
ncbi:uncharacterized protein [Drosophila tropicalis]|uniref:uncharacterized protein isoform X1 n=2 Tax=Drosophila tropicalis TaxID=46794 RepID=UPI0035AB8F7C